MSIPQLSLAFGHTGTVTWPVTIKVPRSVVPGKDSQTAAKHADKVCYVNFAFLSDREINELLDTSEALSNRLLAAEEKCKSVEGEKDRKSAEKERSAAEKEFKSWRELFLRRVVVGFPENHGWDAIFQDLPEFSSDLVEAMASYRTIGKALETAYWAMLDPSK